jgi:two-component system nitrate/nitrite response regulator NarL
MNQISTETIKVMIVDDHQVMRGGLKMLIESHPGLVVVGEAGDPKEALSVIPRVRPDIILLDLDLKGESGLDLLPEITSQYPESQVLILTGLRDTEIHRHCVKIGARGLVQKELAADVLIKAIKKVHKGEVWFDRTMMSSILSDVLNKKNAKESDPERAKIATLTDRETQVINLVCEGLKNKQIAERLFISDTTVRHHLTSIFSKLEISDRLELVIYSYRYGLAKPPK